MYCYIVGDIHGTLHKLVNLYEKIKDLIEENDTLIFLGDYIDRGPHSYEVIEFLIDVSRHNNTVFLRGNHEEMLMNFVAGRDAANVYLLNGGRETIRSYKKHLRQFMIPENHYQFYKNLQPYYEGEDFIAIHAGLNPKYNSIGNQSVHDTLWIREDFFTSSKRWDKTVIFGHTLTIYMTKNMRQVYCDDRKNIIGIDTGAVYGGLLSCIRMPDRIIFQS